MAGLPNDYLNYNTIGGASGAAGYSREHFVPNEDHLYQRNKFDFQGSPSQRNYYYSPSRAGGNFPIEADASEAGDAHPHPRSLNLSFSRHGSSTHDSPDDSNARNYAQKSIGLIALVADNLLSHPFIVLRRQCQVNMQTRKYHLFPLTLIGPVFHICQNQGFGVLWKGLGSTLMVRGMTMAVEDVTSKVTPWPKEISRHSTLKAFMQHILLKSISIAVITPFYSASLVETVQSEVASEAAGFFDVFKEGFLRLLSWPCTGRLVPLHVLVIPTVTHGILSYLIYSGIKSVSLATIRRVRESKERKQGALSKDTTVSSYMEMTASLVGHMVADILLFPLETILHRLHLQGTRTIIDGLDKGLEVMPIITSYGGILDCVKTTVEDEGVSGLYKGFGALVLQYGLQILLIRMVKIVVETNPFGQSTPAKEPPFPLVLPEEVAQNLSHKTVPISRSEPSIIRNFDVPNKEFYDI